MIFKNGEVFGENTLFNNVINNAIEKENEKRKILGFDIKDGIKKDHYYDFLNGEVVMSIDERLEIFEKEQQLRREAILNENN